MNSNLSYVKTKSLSQLISLFSIFTRCEYEPKAFDCLLGQLLYALENCLVLLNSSHELESKDTQSSIKSLKDSHFISVDLLSLICPPLVLFKAKSLLNNPLYLPSLYSSATSVVSLYNNYKDDAVLTLISNTFKLKQIHFSSLQIINSTA